jgi:hypothetical protein
MMHNKTQATPTGRGRSRQMGFDIARLLFIVHQHSATPFNNCDFTLPNLASSFPFTIRTARVTPGSSPHPKPPAHPPSPRAIT